MEGAYSWRVACPNSPIGFEVVRIECKVMAKKLALA